MIVLGLLSIYFLGLSIVNSIDKDQSPMEKIGLSFLIGCGAQTFFMFFFDLIQVKFTAWWLLALSFLLIIILNIGLIKNFKKIKNPFSGLKIKNPFREISAFNWAWLGLLALIAYFLIASFMKSLYWPVTAYDSVAGYDLMAKAIAHEGKILVSLFKWDLQGPRGIYPPLAEGSFAYAYLFGLASSKLMVSLFYLSLVITFYSLLKKYTSAIGAAIFTLVLVITPEMYAFSSISNTNIPGAAYGGLAILYLFIWTDKKNTFSFYIAAIFMGLNVWLRSDGIIFNICGLMILLWVAVRDKEWKHLLLYALIAFSPFIVWSLYLKFAIGIVQDRFVDHLFWDGERFKQLFNGIGRLIGNTQLYGLSFYLFFAAILINIKHIHKDKHLLLIMIIISLLGFAAIYYQLDELKQDPLDKMIRNSFKRGLFYFIPMVLFYTATNKTMQKFFAWIERFRLNQPTKTN